MEAAAVAGAVDWDRSASRQATLQLHMNAGMASKQFSSVQPDAVRFTNSPATSSKGSEASARNFLYYE